MSSKIDIKLDYLNATKSLIKQAIINKGINVTDDTTLREYANLINSIEVANDQSDATVSSSDIVLNKIAYSDNNRVVGNLPIYNSINAEITDMNLDDTSQMLRGKYNTDMKLVLDDNSNIQLSISYSRLADIIGLTQDVIKDGVTILGITGTYNGTAVKSNLNLEDL